MAERYALVIDDDTTFRDRISELLAPHAIEVSSTADEAEALSLLENLHPVLVILAVELPDKNGFALFRKVKNTDFDVPIIITTATLTKAELSRHETQPSHAEYYLDKTNLSVLLRESDSDLLEAIAKAGRLELTTRNVVSRAKPVAEPQSTTTTTTTRSRAAARTSTPVWPDIWMTRRLQFSPGWTRKRSRSATIATSRPRKVRSPPNMSPSSRAKSIASRRS